MKRIAYILLTCAVLGTATMLAEPASTSSRIEAAATQQPTATGGLGHIYLTAASSEVAFSIYSITGQLLRTVRVPADSHVSVELPKGFYIVKCNAGWSRKVVVK